LDYGKFYFLLDVQRFTCSSHVADGLSGANFKVHEFFSHLDGACKMGRCLLVGSALVSTQKLLSECVAK